MKKAPNVIQLRHLAEMTSTAQAEINGHWVPLRPMGFFSLGSRLRAAWLVFTGKADALVWPEGQ